jgi:hypothetical protein
LSDIASSFVAFVQTALARLSSHSARDLPTSAGTN